MVWTIESKDEFRVISSFEHMKFKKLIESHVEPFFKSSLKSSLKKRQNDSNCECQCYQEYAEDKHGEDR